MPAVTKDEPARLLQCGRGLQAPIQEIRSLAPGSFIFPRVE